MLLLLRQGRLSKWFSGIGQEAIAVGVAAGARGRRLDPARCTATSASSRRAASTCAAVPPALRQATAASRKGRDRTFHFGAARAAHRRDDQPPRRDAAGGRRPGPGRAAARRAARGRRLHRRRRDERRRLPRGGEPGRGLEAARALRHREQPVRPLDAGRPSSTRARDLADRGVGYGIPGEVVDGNDLLAVLDAVARGRRARARAATGRRCSSSRPSACAATRRPRAPPTSRKQLFEEWAAQGSGRCASRQLLRRARRARRRRRATTLRAELKAHHRRAGGRGAGRARSGLDAPSASWPTSTRRRAPRRRRPQPRRRRREMRYVDAISDGLREAMRRDPSVVLIGQDIAEYGGVFKVTEGFVEEFGKARVRNTPIIESGALGAALGLALDGFRADGRDAVRRLHHLRLQPDRQQPGQDALPLGRARARSWSACPWAAAWAPGRSTRRTSRRGSRTSPGLKVVAPATPYDAKGLLLAAFEDGNPVLYLEHKLLYRSAQGPRARRATTRVPLGRGARRARRHATPPSSPTASACSGRSRPRPRWPREGREIEVDRPAHAAALGPRDGARVGAQDRARARPARGARHRRLRRRGGGGDRRRRRSSGSTRRSRAWARSTRRCRSARRSRRSSRRRDASSRRFATCSRMRRT